MDGEPLSVEVTGEGIALVTLDRPAVRNAFDDRLIAGLAAAFARLDADDSVRAVVLQATGPHFSAGADLAWMRRMGANDAAENRADALALAEMLRALDTLRHPVIARVQGAALAGATGLVACCDVAIAAAVALAGAVAARAADYAGHRILHIDSYHAGNEWNDRIAAAVRDTLAGTGVELRIHHLDTKRNPSDAFGREAGEQARRLIEAFDPDVVTVSDDNAAKFLIEPFYRNADRPFVFSGLNWDASVYGLPYANVTGMVEVSPIPQILALLRRYAEGDRLGLLTEDTTTKRKERDHHRKLFGIEYEKTYFVRSFDDWKESFRRAQDEVDMLLLLGVAAVADWDDEAARAIVEAHTRIPSGTDFGWLMHLALLGVGKVPEEQGRWAAQAALRIIDGVPPSAIPLAYNKEGQLFLNRTLARKLGITSFPPLATIVE